MTTRVRFAPSPTGHLHVGGARTALFNWLFARGRDGDFILRIEDTDQSRSTEASIDQIKESLSWMRLTWDEYYRQTERSGNYEEKADLLLNRDRVYEKEGALWFRVPAEETVLVKDQVLGRVKFETEDLKDFVIRRSDGTFTYNFACAADDSEMEISHVMRGDDHLNNTPKQILIYEALDLEPPKFAHFPMILGEDHKRLSKRHGATSVLNYREKGILPEGLTNFLARLGWSHGDKEIFSRQELIEYFSLDNVGESSAVFDEEKLLWINHQWMKRKDPEKLGRTLKKFLLEETSIREDQLDELEKTRLTKLAEHFRERNKTLRKLAKSSDFVFSRNIDYDETPIEDHLTEESAELVGELAKRLEEVPEEDFKAEKLEEITRDFLASRDKGLGDIAQVCRVGLTGREVSPGLFITMELVGKDRVTDRLTRVATTTPGVD
ncbi:glutamate--tRNA ligase [Candidatus Bipolaricaulota bacterium]|nr:glutamate--tRNA ligase [Candidatus Bipolaricaulota bacterium]